jgi:hypothetical protein
VTYLLEHTPLRVFGLSHLVVAQKLETHSVQLSGLS